MALTPKLELRQGQSLVMTPQLQQAIKLLQLSNLDLSAYVEQELEKNPLLENGESTEPSSDGDMVNADENGEGASTEEGDSSTTADPESVEATDNMNLVDADVQLSDEGAKADAGSDLDTDFENVYTDDAKIDQPSENQSSPEAAADNWQAPTSTPSGPLSEDYSIDQLGSPERSLRDHLTEQLQIAITDPTRRLIGADIVDSVNEAGYMTASVEGVADRLGAKTDDVESVLTVLHTFDPVGILARDLPECLRIQLREKDRLDPAMDALLNNLDLLAKRDFPALGRSCGVDQEDILDMVSEIQELNPKPGTAFGDSVIQPVVPDVFIREKPGEGWHVELNSETLPRVLVNARYYAQISKSAHTKDDKVYLNECLNNANWLVKSLDQRAKTILKVSSEIVKQQDGFLAHGVEHLRPLNLKTIAEAIEMHESTVSRVTANKYVATPRGVFDMKYFFTSAIPSNLGGEAHSAEAVRARIRTFINAEDPKVILSDDKLVLLLKDDGIDIARRTVAKYREAMRIPSSVQRRRLKKLIA